MNVKKKKKFSRYRRERIEKNKINTMLITLVLLINQITLEFNFIINITYCQWIIFGRRNIGNEIASMEKSLG